MKRFISVLLIFLLSTVIFSSCTMADKIEEGTYICKTPYIKYIYGDVDYKETSHEIEIDKKVYTAFAYAGYDGTIEFVEYQEEDVRGWGVDDDNKSYAKFDYKFDNNKKQLILTDRKTGNVYHLDKVE